MKSKTRRVIGKILKAPLVLLGLASIPASIYAAANDIGGIGYSTAVVFAGIMIAYFAGFYLDRVAWFEIQTTPVEEQEEDYQQAPKENY